VGRIDAVKQRLVAAGEWLGAGLVILSIAWLVSSLVFRLTHGPVGFVFGVKVSVRDIPGTVLEATGLGILGLAFTRWREYFGRLAAWIGKRWYWPVAIWMALCLAWWLVTLWNIRTMALSGLDTALFENIIYRISRGNLSPEFMGIHHPYFLFYPMGLVYRLAGFPGAILVQKLVLFSAIPGAWLLARELGLDERGAGATTLLVALLPLTWWMGGDAPYPDVAFLSLGIFLVWAGLRNNYALVATFALGILLTNESGGLTLACAGVVLWALARRKRWLWLVPLGIAAIPLAFWFQDLVAPGRAGGRLLYRYGIESITPLSLLKVGLRVFWPSRLFAFGRLLVQAGHLSFLEFPLAALAIVPAAPQLAVIAKGTNQATLGLYHGFYSLPLVIVAAIAALRRFGNVAFHVPLAIGLSLLVGMRLFRVAPPASFVARTAEIAALVPPDVPVAAAPYVSLKLAKRPYLRIVQNPDELSEELGRTRPWVVLEGLGFKGIGAVDSLLLPLGYERVFEDTCSVIWRPGPE
jgi:uncharacterized membrane protein